MSSFTTNQSTSSGFYKAPVCKGLLGTLFLTGSVIYIPMANRLRHLLICKIPQLLSTPQIWRILLNRVTFIHPKDLICSVLIIYCFRIFERRMGSRKFSSFLLGSCTLATILEILSIIMLQHFDLNFHNGGYLPPGMYSIIFPLFVNYFLDIPRVSESNILGIPISSKTFTYLLGLQIASTSSATMIAAFCGIVGGLLYRLNFAKVQSWLVVPSAVCDVVDRLLGWALHSKEPKYQPMGATLDLQRQEQADLWEQQYLYNRAQDMRNRFGGNEVPQGGGGIFGSLFRNRRHDMYRQIEPSAENIQILVNMGFDRTAATEALRAASNDLGAATTILLRG